MAKRVVSRDKKRRGSIGFLRKIPAYRDHIIPHIHGDIAIAFRDFFNGGQVRGAETTRRDYATPISLFKESKNAKENACLRFRYLSAARASSVTEGGSAPLRKRRYCLVVADLDQRRAIPFIRG